MVFWPKRYVFDFGLSSQHGVSHGDTHIGDVSSQHARDNEEVVSLFRLGGFQAKLGGGFNYSLFSPLFGEDSHFDSYFSDGLKPPTRKPLPFVWGIWPNDMFTQMV